MGSLAVGVFVVGDLWEEGIVGLETGAHVGVVAVGEEGRCSITYIVEMTILGVEVAVNRTATIELCTAQDKGPVTHDAVQFHGPFTRV